MIRYAGLDNFKKEKEMMEIETNIDSFLPLGFDLR